MMHDQKNIKLPVLFNPAANIPVSDPAMKVALITCHLFSQKQPAFQLNL